MLSSKVAIVLLHGLCFVESCHRYILCTKKNIGRLCAALSVTARIHDEFVAVRQATRAAHAPAALIVNAGTQLSSPRSPLMLSATSPVLFSPSAMPTPTVSFTQSFTSFPQGS